LLFGKLVQVFIFSFLDWSFLKAKEKSTSTCSDGSIMPDPFLSSPNTSDKASFVERILSSLILPKFKKRLKQRLKQRLKINLKSNLKRRKRKRKSSPKNKPKLKFKLKQSLKKLITQADLSLTISKDNFKTAKTKERFLPTYLTL
jgi:hypothetical protein